MQWAQLPLPENRDQRILLMQGPECVLKVQPKISLEAFCQSGAAAEQIWPYHELAVLALLHLVQRLELVLLQ